MKNKVRVGGEVSRRSHKPEELGASPRPATKYTEWGTGKDLYSPTFTKKGLKKLIKHMEKNLKEIDKRFGFGKEEKGEYYDQ